MPIKQVLMQIKDEPSIFFLNFYTKGDHYFSFNKDGEKVNTFAQIKEESFSHFHNIYSLEEDMDQETVEEFL